MKLYKLNEQKKRRILEREINRAAEGEYHEKEISDLKERLADYPDLLNSFSEIMDLPDLQTAYSTIRPNKGEMERRVNRVLSAIDSLERPTVLFGDIAITWFKRYALVASVLMVAVSSGLYFSQSVQPNSDVTLEELLYPSEGEEAETYVLYLEQLIEP